MGRMIAFESLIERDLISLLDYEPRVAEFVEQPLTITYEDQGKSRTYTPDFQARLREGRQLLFECKPQRLVTAPDNQMKFSAARQWCQRQGWEFVVVTDAQLATGWRVKNIQLLTQFARHHLAAETEKRILTCLAGWAGTARVEEVMQHIAPQNPPTALIPMLHLTFHQGLQIPLDEAPITPASPVALAGTWVEKEPWLR
jgi:hypothetical protein